MLTLCMPALIYLIFSFTHVIIDTYKGLYNTAMIEVWISLLFTLLLNLLCEQNLGFVSWIIISIPFLLMTVIASLVLFMFKLNPSTGQQLTQTSTQNSSQNQLSQTSTQTTSQTYAPSVQPTSTQNPSQTYTTQPTSTYQPLQSSTSSQPSQTYPSKPSRYAFPVDVFYGSLGNYKPPQPSF